MTYVGAFLWGFGLIASFCGYGMMVGRALGRRHVDGGLAVGWGISLLIVVGGVLNLAGVISPVLVLSLVVAGQAAWLVQGGPGRLFRAMRRMSAWDCLGLAVLLLGYINWLCFNARTGVEFNIYMVDDSSYTLFPVRMLQTGSMGIDPFNDRLTLTSLGGMPFLQTLILAVLPIEYIHLTDPGLAYPAIGVLLFSGWLARLSAPARAMLALVFACTPTSSSNASAVAMPLVLLMGLTRALERSRPGGPIRRGVGVALLLAALLTLKTTLIATGISFVFFRGIILAATSRRLRPLLEGAITAIVLIGLLFPWMLYSTSSSGSIYYPLLGEGFRKHSVNVAPHRTASVRTTAQGVAQVVRAPQMPVMIFGLVAASAFLVMRTSGAYLAAHLAAIASCLFTLFLFMTAFGDGGHFWRYFYPIEAFGLVVGYAILLRFVPEKGRWRQGRMALFLIAAGYILFYAPKAVVRSKDLPEAIAAGFRGRTKFTRAEVDQFRRFQDSAPPAIPIFSVVDWPLLFDLKRNPIYYHDNWGNVSPPPGIPLAGEPEEIANYLRSLGIRHLACDGPERLTTLIDDKYKLIPRLEASPAVTEWFVALQRGKLKFLESLDELARRYSLLYDDGRYRMIDLSSPTPDRADSLRIQPSVSQPTTKLLLPAAALGESLSRVA